MRLFYASASAKPPGLLVSYRPLADLTARDSAPSVRARAPHTPHTACSLYTHYGTRRAQKTLPILTRAATNTRTAKFEKQKRYSRTSKAKADATRYNKGA